MGILYSYAESRNGVDAKPSDTHWVEFGTAIKKLHGLSIPSSVTQDVSRETFSSKWRETIKAFLIRIENEVFEEPVAVKMALFLKSKRCEILKLIEHAETLAILIPEQRLTYVLCHADTYDWNLIFDKEDTLYIVKLGWWPNSCRTRITILSRLRNSRNQSDAPAYYRFERIIQDIGDYFVNTPLCLMNVMTIECNALNIYIMRQLKEHIRPII